MVLQASREHIKVSVPTGCAAGDSVIRQMAMSEGEFDVTVLWFEFEGDRRNGSVAVDFGVGTGPSVGKNALRDAKGDDTLNKRSVLLPLGNFFDIETEVDAAADSQFDGAFGKPGYEAPGLSEVAPSGLK